MPTFAQALAALRRVRTAAGLTLRLGYVLALMLFTAPLIFYSLTAYQYHQTIHAMARADTDLDARRLAYLAAEWKTGMAAWTAAVAEATHRAQADRLDPAAAAAGYLKEPGLQGPLERAVAAQLAIDRAIAAPGRRDGSGTLTAAAVGAPDTPERSAEPSDQERRAAQTLAGELARFDTLAMPAWFLAAPHLFEVYERPSLVAELPDWALVLLVTMLAGLLGSLIFVLKTTLRTLLDNLSGATDQPRQHRPLSWLVLRPALGVVTALGAYVALQSGLLVLDTGSGEASIPNAHVTAVVGLIAGLLSWQMIDTLEGLGARWLNRRRPLWGYGLAGRMAARETTRAQLAQRLNLAAPLLDDWIDLRVPVPADQVDRVASELNADPDTLFLPVPPWRHAAGARNGPAAGT